MKLLETKKFLIKYTEETPKSTQWLNERLSQIEQHGIYEPTTEEVTFAARLAWRNSNKCVGRLFWQSLHVFDERHLLDEEKIFQALLRHIDFATNNGKIRPAITVFAANRVRIFNHQLLRYAGYETENGIVGDPHSLEFTKLCIELGWQGTYTSYDILPLIIQVDDRAPKIFQIPAKHILEVDIQHPDYPAMAELQMKWYAVPIISNMKLACGDIEFQAAPFNGWYMGTEIGARNLADRERYNRLPDVAQALGIEAASNMSLWKDRALVELNFAVLHSFKAAGVSIVDHHTATQQFQLFQQREKQAGRAVTGNWVWLVPPLSPATTHIFHEPIDNTIHTPNYFYQKNPY